MTREEKAQEFARNCAEYNNLPVEVEHLLHTAFIVGYNEKEDEEKNPWHKASEELPPHFGDYLVIIDSELYGRRYCIKCWFGESKDYFGDNPSKEWVLEADERVSYWMPIPEIKED